MTDWKKVNSEIARKVTKQKTNGAKKTDWKAVNRELADRQYAENLYNRTVEKVNKDITRANNIASRDDYRSRETTRAIYEEYRKSRERTERAKDTLSAFKDLYSEDAYNQLSGTLDTASRYFAQGTKNAHDSAKYFKNFKNAEEYEGISSLAGKTLEDQITAANAKATAGDYETSHSMFNYAFGNSSIEELERWYEWTATGCRYDGYISDSNRELLKYWLQEKKQKQTDEQNEAVLSKYSDLYKSEDFETNKQYKGVVYNTNTLHEDEIKTLGNIICQQIP